MGDILRICKTKMNIMKNCIILVLVSLCLNINAQDAQVEKSIYGIQTGFLGIWLNHEARLASQFVLRIELGFDSGISGGANRKTSFLFTPVLTLEPIRYCNLEKRSLKSNNSANFISLKTSFNPDRFTISKESKVTLDDQISTIPTWGIKRSTGKNFTYETGFGVGYRFYFKEPKRRTIKERTNVAVNLHLRIGYIS